MAGYHLDLCYDNCNKIKKALNNNSNAKIKFEKLTVKISKKGKYIREKFYEWKIGKKIIKSVKEIDKKFMDFIPFI
jgi:hypothetical protein